MVKGEAVEVEIEVMIVVEVIVEAVTSEEVLVEKVEVMVEKVEVMVEVVVVEVMVEAVEVKLLERRARPVPSEASRPSCGAEWGCVNAPGKAQGAEGPPS